MVVFTDGWAVQVGGQSRRVGDEGQEVVATCHASSEDNYDPLLSALRRRDYADVISFTVPWAVTHEPLPRHSIIAALKKQPEWKAWEKKRLQGKV